MNRCFIFGALPVTSLPVLPGEGDYRIAADKGIVTMQHFGIEPDLVVGDFDSLGYDPGYANQVTLQVRKDDTDTAHAMEMAFAEGYRDFVVYGCVGGRLEHSFANIQLADDLTKRGARVLFIGERECFTVIRDGSISFPAEYRGRISVFALTNVCWGVTIRGLSYELENAVLQNTVPLGVSNEFTGSAAQISVETGSLLIIRDRQDL